MRNYLPLSHSITVLKISNHSDKSINTKVFSDTRRVSENLIIGFGVPLLLNFMGNRQQHTVNGFENTNLFMHAKFGQHVGIPIADYKYSPSRKHAE